MITATINRNQMYLKVEGTSPELITETTIMLGILLRKISQKLNIPINDVAQMVGKILPMILNDLEEADDKS